MGAAAEWAEAARWCVFRVGGDRCDGEESKGHGVGGLVGFYRAFVGI